MNKTWKEGKYAVVAIELLNHTGLVVKKDSHTVASCEVKAGRPTDIEFAEKPTTAGQRAINRKAVDLMIKYAAKMKPRASETVRKSISILK